MLPEVEKGAALLDQVNPDWWKHIDLNILQMNNCSRCIIGQLYEGNYSYGLKKIGVLIDYKTVENDRLYGFDTPDFGNTPSYMALKLNWIEAINERKMKHEAQETNQAVEKHQEESGREGEANVSD